MALIFSFIVVKTSSDCRKLGLKWNLGYNYDINHLTSTLYSELSVSVFTQRKEAILETSLTHLLIQKALPLTDLRDDINE